MALNFSARADGVVLADVIDRLVGASCAELPTRSRSRAAIRPRAPAEALGARLPPLLVAAERVAATVAQGVHGRRRVGQGDSFWQFRRFVAGDPVAPHRLAAVRQVRPPACRTAGSSARPSGKRRRPSACGATPPPRCAGARARRRWRSANAPTCCCWRWPPCCCAAASGCTLIARRTRARCPAAAAWTGWPRTSPPRATTMPACRRGCRCRGTPAWCCSATSSRRWRRSRR